jgi:hypothetical protein
MDQRMGVEESQQHKLGQFEMIKEERDAALEETYTQ